MARRALRRNADHEGIELTPLIFNGVVTSIQAALPSQRQRAGQMSTHSPLRKLSPSHRPFPMSSAVTSPASKKHRRIASASAMIPSKDVEAGHQHLPFSSSVQPIAKEDVRFIYIIIITVISVPTFFTDYKLCILVFMPIGCFTIRAHLFDDYIQIDGEIFEGFH